MVSKKRGVITLTLREDHSGACTENEWPVQSQGPL